MREAHITLEIDPIQSRKQTKQKDEEKHTPGWGGDLISGSEIHDFLILIQILIFLANVQIKSPTCSLFLSKLERKYLLRFVSQNLPVFFSQNLVYYVILSDRNKVALRKHKSISEEEEEEEEFLWV
mgnify:FL=1